MGEHKMEDDSQTGPLSRRERLKQEREERILEAAAAVFADKGFHQATIRDVAVLADVADGTIYNYFDSKFDLLFGIMARVAELERLPAELVEALNHDVRGFFVQAFDDRLGRIEKGREMLQAVLPEVFVNADLREQFYEQYVLRISRLLEGYLQAQVEMGRLRPVNVPLTVRLVQGMFVGLLVLRIFGDEPLQSGWEEVPEALATMVLDGLSASDGE
jgi:TetR/AcrR family fatty acid metabolism transcriptional regulator